MAVLGIALVQDALFVAEQKYVISPSINVNMRKTYDDFKRYMDIFNKSGELCNKSGMKFGYHNHDYEFIEKLKGDLLFDIMMKSIDPKLVVIKLDMGKPYKRIFSSLHKRLKIYFRTK
jgi:hypothetical protein